MPGGRKPGVWQAVQCYRSSSISCSAGQEFRGQLGALEVSCAGGLGVPEHFSSLRLGGSRSSSSASGAFECQDASDATSSEGEVEWESSRRMDDDSSQEEGDCSLRMEGC